MEGKAEQENRQTQETDPRNTVDQGVELLLKELEQGKSEKLEQYLAFTARFHRYSVNNQMLIFMQCPKATFVAGYRAWREMGYQVARGQKAIHILAPHPFQRVDKETGDIIEGVSFVAVSVFDASQLADLDEHPVPTFFTPLADDQHALLARLGKVATEDGIAISENWTGLAQGYSSGRRITLREDMDSQNKVLTLLHEYTHEILHWHTGGQDQPRQVKECHAEAVAFVVAHHFGIHNPFSADYLQNWGTTPKELKAELEIVRHTAAYIIERIEKPEDETKPPNAMP